MANSCRFRPDRIVAHRSRHRSVRGQSIDSTWILFACQLRAANAPYWEIFDTMFTTRFGLAVLLLAVGSMWFAVLLVMRVLHRRPLSTLLGATARLSWHDFARSFAIWFVVGVVSSAIFFTMDVTAARSETNLLEWAAAFLPLSLFILLQSSAEELVFRGYLQQSLAQRFPHWLAWAILPGIAFTLPHWDFEALPWMNAAYLMSVAVFSIAMTVLVCATGNLGAAFGAHFATNLVALLLFSSDGDYRSAALFVGLPMQDPSWTPTDAALITLSMIALTALTVTLSIHPRSPFKLRSRQFSYSPTPVF